MRCAVVDVANNRIDNVIVADPAVDPAPGGEMLALVPDFVNPGVAYNGGVFPTPGSSAVAALGPSVAPTSSGVDLL